VGNGCTINAAWQYYTGGTDSAHFYAADTASNVTFYWHFGDGTIGSGRYPWHGYSQPGTYHVCLYVYISGTNCLDSSCNNITIVSPCNLNAAWQYYTIGDSAHFYAADTSTSANYYWHFGDGTTGTGRLPWHHYTQPGTYYACLYVSNTALNCLDSFCSTVVIGSGCTVNSSWSYTVSGDTVRFVGADTNTAAHHIYNFGDGTYSTSGVNVTHVYSGPGTYHVCFYVYIPGSTCSDSTCNDIIIDSSCNVNAAWQYYAYGTDSAHFYASNTVGNVSYYWHFGDGTVGTGSNPWHGYSQPGTYHVCLYASIGTNCTDSFCSTVIIGSGCNINASWSYTLHGDTVYLVSTDTSSANHHIWIFDYNTSTVTSGTSITHVFTGAGTYHVCLYVYTPGTTCSDSSCNNVTIVDSCVTDAAWISVIHGDSVYFYATDTNSTVHYDWNAGDGNYVFGTHPVHVYAGPGTYHVCLYAYVGNCLDSFCNTITVGSGCNITSAWTYTASGDSVSFTTANTNTASHHYWNFGDGTGTSAFNVSHTYTAPGTYHVCYYVYLPNTNCFDSTCNDITITGGCNLTAAWNFLHTNGDTFHFYALIPDSNVYILWTFGDGTTSSGSYVIHTYPQPGTYEVCVHAYIPGTPCSDSLCISVTFGDSCAVTAAWTSISHPNDSVQFYALDPDTTAHHYWTFGDGGSASGSYATHTYAQSGTYNVCLYVYIPGTTCSDSLCQNVNSILGVTDIGSYPTITLSPNPFSQYAVMNISGPASVYEVHIYDMTGRMIRIDHSANNSIMIERGGLSSGIYLYEVQAGDMIIGKGKMSVE
jgi:PKD repeat protein